MWDEDVGFVSDAMSELQATIELSVELGKFYNVDLFQRGQVLLFFKESLGKLHISSEGYKNIFEKYSEAFVFLVHFLIKIFVVTHFVSPVSYPLLSTTTFYQG